MTDQEFEDKYLPSTITYADCYEVSFQVNDNYYNTITTRHTEGLNTGGGFNFWYPQIVLIKSAPSYYDDINNIIASRVVVPCVCTDVEAREYTGDYTIEYMYVTALDAYRWAFIIDVSLGPINMAQAITRGVRDIRWPEFIASTQTFFYEPGIRQPDIEIKGTRNIPDNMFAELALSEVILPRTELEYIGENAFRGYNSQISNHGVAITIGPNVTYIGANAFRNWNYLTDIQIENSEYEFDYNNIFWVAKGSGHNQDEDGYQITYLITTNNFVMSYNWKENFNRVLRSSSGALIIKVRGSFRRFKLYDEGNIPVKLGESNTKYLKIVNQHHADADIALVKVNGAYYAISK